MTEELEAVVTEETLKSREYIPLKIGKDNYYVKLTDAVPIRKLYIYKQLHVQTDWYELHHVFKEDGSNAKKV